MRLDRQFREIYQELIKSLEERRGEPFGAGLITKEGDVIAVGTNEVIATDDISRHAEIVALANAGEKLETIFLPETIILATHYPCLMCYNAIKLAGVKKGYYIFESEETEKYFGLGGGDMLLDELGITKEMQRNDIGLDLQKYSSEEVNELYYGTLVERWNEEYKHICIPH